MTRAAWTLAVLALLTVAIGALALWRWELEAPVVTVESPILMGREGKRVSIHVVDEGSGLRDLAVILESAAGERTLLEVQGEGGWLFGSGNPEGESFEVSILPSALNLREGDAFLRVQARDWSWSHVRRGNLAVERIPLTIDLSPPLILVQNGLTYVSRGGSSAVIYSVDEPVHDDGVMVGEQFFKGHPFPDSKNEMLRAAVFAVPRNAGPSPKIQVVAVDEAGNRGSAGWSTRIKEREFPEVPIRLPQSFLDQKVTSLGSRLGVDVSDPLEAFRQINVKVREQNEEKIREVALSGSSPPLWRGAFGQLANSKVTSGFAEHRIYMIEEEKVSEAIHYGYDLASTAGAPITASNSGRVLFAEELGIYGRCVIVDHGLGVVSLYGHLSRIDVQVGDGVEKGQSLGLSGQTGFAGGDHLHFAILVGGVYVDPLEWWDPKWVQDHVADRLGMR